MYNIVLITIDCLRPDYMDSYDEKAKFERLTPNLDAWAQDAVIFKNAISHGPCTPVAFPPLLSGQYMTRYLDAYSGLSLDRPIIAKVLKDKGFHTCAFNSNPYISKHNNYNEGFNVFEDNLFRHKKGSIFKKFIKPYINLKALLREPYIIAGKLNDQVLNFLEGKSSPYFLWVHYMDVHGPFVPKDGFKLVNNIRASLLWRKITTYSAPYVKGPEKITEKEKQTLIKNYKEEVKYVDHHISVVLDKLDPNSTIVILTADHGELLGEHELFTHQPIHLYDELLRVPLIIKVPLAFNFTEKRIDRMVKHLDIVPTLLDLLGIKEDYSFDGESLVPLMHGNFDAYKCRHIISEIWTKYLSIRTDKWKLIANYVKKDMKLFDLEADPGETQNLYERYKNIAEELEVLIHKHLIEVKAPDRDLEQCGFFNTQDDDVLKTRLKGLGYL